MNGRVERSHSLPCTTTALAISPTLSDAGRPGVIGPDMDRRMVLFRYCSYGKMSCRFSLEYPNRSEWSYQGMFDRKMALRIHCAFRA